MRKVNFILSFTVKEVNFAWLYSEKSQLCLVYSEKSQLRSILQWEKSTLLEFTVKSKLDFHKSQLCWILQRNSQHRSILLSKESTLLHFTVKIVNFAPFRFSCGKGQLCSILLWNSQLCSMLQWKKVNFAPFWCYCELSQLCSISILLWTESTLIHFDFTVNWVNFAPF